MNRRRSITAPNLVLVQELTRHELLLHEHHEIRRQIRIAANLNDLEGQAALAEPHRRIQASLEAYAADHVLSLPVGAEDQAALDEPARQIDGQAAAEDLRIRFRLCQGDPALDVEEDAVLAEQIAGELRRMYRRIRTG